MMSPFHSALSRVTMHQRFADAWAAADVTLASSRF